jgi:2-methylcitrate dehydratase PrpD
VSHPEANARADSAQTESERIAGFALNLDLESIPDKVQVLAKEHLLDALGIAIASTGFDFGKVALKAVHALGEGGKAAAIGSGIGLSAPSAALLNGLLAHGLDYDDTHIAGIYHASAPALGAALAAGQAVDASGAQVLIAFTAALEVGCRLALAAAGDLTHRGFHPTAVCGTFAAAVAAGRLFGLDSRQMTDALGLCGSQASGVLETGSSWLKRFHPGWSAHAGVVAAAFGQAGFIGPDTILEGARGFYATHVQQIPTGERAPSFGLGQTWHSLGIALKPYPCCHVIHAAVDAALEFRGQFDLADVERIECPLVLEWHKLIAEPRDACIRPPNPYRALFSVPYVVALALVRGRVDLAAFYDEPLDAPEVLDLAARVWCIDDPLSDYPAHFPGEVIVHLKDGRVLRNRKSASLGTQEYPLSRDEVSAKFMSNATRVIDAHAAEELQSLVLNIETQASLAEIMRLSRSN